MPPFAQDEMLKTIKGLENAKIMRYGYAIEYDYIPANQLKLTLETKIVENLYTAGTINGTSGYEESCSSRIYSFGKCSEKNKRWSFYDDRSEGYNGID